MIKDEIYEFVLEFLDSGSLVRAINVTWLSLIPKSVVPCSIEDYRPISMVGAFV